MNLNFSYLRSATGFGFTVRGDAPVLVANVEGMLFKRLKIKKKRRLATTHSDSVV